MSRFHTFKTHTSSFYIHETLPSYGDTSHRVVTALYTVKRVVTGDYSIQMECKIKKKKKNKLPKGKINLVNTNKQTSFVQICSGVKDASHWLTSSERTLALFSYQTVPVSCLCPKTETRLPSQNEKSH